jgi:hypothetical protein
MTARREQHQEEGQEPISTVELDPEVQSNLQSTMLDIETSSNYFKPEDGKTYIIKFNPKTK